MSLENMEGKTQETVGHLKDPIQAQVGHTAENPKKDEVKKIAKFPSSRNRNIFFIRI